LSKSSHSGVGFGSGIVTPLSFTPLWFRFGGSLGNEPGRLQGFGREKVSGTNGTSWSPNAKWRNDLDAKAPLR
jgi:hypothetical protein